MAPASAPASAELWAWFRLTQKTPQSMAKAVNAMLKDALDVVPAG